MGPYASLFAGLRPGSARTRMLAASAWAARPNVVSPNVRRALERERRSLTPAQRDCFDVLVSEWSGSLGDCFEAARSLS